MAAFGGNKSPNAGLFEEDKFNYGGKNGQSAEKMRQQQEALVRSDESDPNMDLHQDDA